MDTQKAPGKFFRQGISLLELTERFPDEASAVAWFEQRRWKKTRTCGHCESELTAPASHKKMPYWCTTCRSYFSVRTGTILENSRIPLRKWVIALYLFATNLKSVSSMKLHRDLNVTQKTAWFMLHRIRKACEQGANDLLLGPVEVDETYMGGTDRNRHEKEKKGNAYGSKTPVVGMRSRTTKKIVAHTIATVGAKSLQRFVTINLAEKKATVYSDQNPGYKGLSRQGYTLESVNHSVKEYVRGLAHTNSIESFWSMLKRGHYGTYHKISPKHLQRYVDEFVGRNNVRDEDTADQMTFLAQGMIGKRLTYKALIA